MHEPSISLQEGNMRRYVCMKTNASKYSYIYQLFSENENSYFWCSDSFIWDDFIYREGELRRYFINISAMLHAIVERICMTKSSKKVCFTPLPELIKPESCSHQLQFEGERGINPFFSISFVVFYIFGWLCTNRKTVLVVAVSKQVNFLTHMCLVNI